MRREMRERLESAARKLFYEARAGGPVGISWPEAVAEAKVLMRCGARTLAGTPCRPSGLPRNGRCALHAGWATGPKSPEAQARSRARMIQMNQSEDGRERSRRIMMNLARWGISE
jgi:hypothetical protein